MERPEGLPSTEELLTVEELRVALRIEVVALAEYVELGVATPRAGPEGRPCVTAADAERLSRALRLARELELHPAGAALLVELLDERERLRRRLEALECLVGPRG